MALTLSEEFDPTTNLPRDIYVANKAYALKNNTTGISLTTSVKATPDGNFEVYSTNRKYTTLVGLQVSQPDQLVYTYNAANNTYTFNTADGYKLSDYSGTQLTNINKNVKTDLYKTIPPNSALVLSKLPGYQSIANSNQPRKPIVDPNASQALQQATGVQQSTSAVAPTKDPTDPTSFTNDINLGEEFKKPKEYSQVLRYPEKQYKEETFDYLKIQVIEYEKSGLIRNDPTRVDLVRPSERLRNKKINGTVILPMQPNISDSNGVSWNEDPLNVFQGLVGSTAFNTVNRASQIQNFNDLKSLIMSLGADLGQSIQTLANDPKMSQLIAGYFGGQAVGANIIGRATGAVINNNLELLFQGPKLRTFRYSYKFTPRSKKEAEIVKQIIRLFKREMATSHSNNGLFLQTPSVFQLKYIYNGDKEGKKDNQHPFLNKIKPCALTNFNVNYTPDGTYMTYADGGSMTSYAVDMEFSELEPIYKEDYDTNEGSKGMGY